MKNRAQALFFAGTSELTQVFPSFGARLLDAPIRSVVTSQWLSNLFKRRNQKTLADVRAFRRLLVHSDIHIGDAVMVQAAVTALRDFFPQADIDVLVGKAVLPLLEGNPEIDRLCPFYAGGTFAAESELARVGKWMQEGKYDLCFNANPFLDDNPTVQQAQPTFNFTSHAPAITRNERAMAEPNHIIFQQYRFVHTLLTAVAKPVRQAPLKGVGVWLTDNAFAEAASFLEGVPRDRRLVLLNTDTASPYTRIPFPSQVELALGLLAQGAFLLVGAGHTEVGIGERLIAALPEKYLSQLRLVPASLSLAGYAALTDRCDLFISGDTGPMHIAAARKHSRSGQIPVRNRTAVLCVFGATPSRLSGYDSFQAGYLASNQDAPSWTVVAGSPCRNITCVNKLFKTCQTIRCFEKLELPAAAALLAAAPRAVD